MHGEQGLKKRILNAFLPIYRLAARLISPLTDRYFEAADVPTPKLISHGTHLAYLSALANKPGMRVLEIGSREVTGKSSARCRYFDRATYVGFDYYAGENVDVIGDAHQLADYFDEPFDVIFATSVFEHLAMPWLVAEEISKVLKVGGTLFIETHFSYVSHERPWHFFQFSDLALRALFSPALGFECVEASMSNPLVARFATQASEYLRLQPVSGLYCHSAFLGRKKNAVDGFVWSAEQLDQIVSGTKYPAPC